MSQYICLTSKGRELLARLAAAQKAPIISRVMFGSGLCPNDENPRLLEDLIHPVATGTSTIPNYNGDTIRMTLEYRNDLNGGLEHGFSIQELGVFVRDEDGSEVMLLYGSLGEPGLWVGAYTAKGIDTRRFPVSIVIGEESEIILDYIPQAFMTAEDVAEYCKITLLPNVLQESAQQVKAQLENKQDKITGQPGYVAVFDKDGKLTAQSYDSDSFNGTWLPLTGGTMSGPVTTLPPTAPGHAANKSYVDNLVGDIGAILDNINGEVG